MKKLLLLLLPIAIIVLLLIFILSSQKQKTSVDGKFGFLRSAGSIKEEKIKDMGATWLRLNFGYFSWDVMQKEENVAIDFSKTDEVVRNTQKDELHHKITLYPYADWEQKEKGGECRVSNKDSSLPQNKGDFMTEGLPYYRCNPNNWTAYQIWLTAFVERYDGDGNNDMPGQEYPVNYYEIVNEPDLTLDPDGEEGTVYYLDTPENYAELLKKTYPIIKLADNNAQVIIAAPAGVQPQFIKYWERIFSTPKIADYFDIANIHCLSAPNQDKNDPTSVSAEDLNVTVYKNLLAKYKIIKPIWVTEAENIQGNDVAKNVERLKSSVNNALINGAEKIFFTGASFSNDPMKYTSEVLISEKNYYKNIILSTK
jgi:hypothetical protein